jgi:hypothetical protein
MFQNIVQRRIFGPKVDEATGTRRKLHNEELLNFYSSSNIIKMLSTRSTKWSGHVACMGEEWDVDRVLVRIPEKISRRT